MNGMNSDTLSLIIYVLVAGFLLALPYVVFPTLPFGVRIPLVYAHDPAVITERKRYALRLGILAGALFLVDIALRSLAEWHTILRLSILILAIAGWGIYYLGHRSLAQVKASENWFAGSRLAVAASLAPGSKKPLKLFWILLTSACVVLVLTVAIGVWRYPALPGTLQFVFPHNLGNWNLVTTPVNAFLPVLLQVVTILFFAGLAWLRTFGSQPVDVEDPEGSLHYQQINIQIIQALLLLLALGLNCAFLVTGLVGWGLLQAGSSISVVLILAPLAGWLIIAPVLLMGFHSNPRVPARDGGFVNRDDDHFWKLGVVYFNRQDPSLLVPKRFGIGRTLNLGHPLAWVILLILVAVILARVFQRL
jgi:uncharacterized membrane protein